MTASWPAKDPDEILDYSWDVPLDAGDTISGTPTIVVVEGSVTAETPSVNGARITTFLSGGEAGETSVIEITCETAGGRTFQQAFSLAVNDAAQEPRSVSMELAKAHLRVRHTDEDALIGQYIATAKGWVDRYTGFVLGEDETYPQELIAAQLILIGFYYQHRDTNAEVPAAVEALAGPFRTPTVA